jgi:23S rRNA (adenine2503-C2)-methyltransferase
VFIITGYPLRAFEEYLAANGVDRYRARQVFDFIYKKARFKFDEIPNLPRLVKGFLSANCAVLSGEITETKASNRDKTTKFLISLPDKSIIESVLLYASGERLSACLSTQVGCAVCCPFCASGRQGLRRNLTTSEIISQYLLMRRFTLGRGADITNIVFMGIGEPLLNYDNLISAIDLLTDPTTVNLAARHITISTAGVVPAIDRLAGYKKQIELSVSLHSAFDKKRDILVPLNKKYSLTQLIPAVKGFIAKTKRQVTFEYVLLKGFNDGKEDAAELTKILKGIHCKINLIPYNPAGNAGFRSPTDSDIKKFINLLKKNRINVIQRQKKGVDINSGCGQLKASFLSE